MLKNDLNNIYLIYIKYMASNIDMIISHIVASYNVLYDKIYDCFTKTEKTTTTNRMYQDKSYYEQYSTFLAPPTHIIDNIYLGSAYNAANWNILENLGIKIIINITKEISNYYPDKFEYKKYEINDNDTADISIFLKDVSDTIKMNADKKIFVHCYMGASRSVSVVIYYLMIEHKMALDEAIIYIKERRTSINPNNKFIESLKTMNKI
jgi:hypothetical protein